MATPPIVIAEIRPLAQTSRNRHEHPQPQRSVCRAEAARAIVSPRRGEHRHLAATPTAAPLEVVTAVVTAESAHRCMSGGAWRVSTDRICDQWNVASPSSPWVVTAPGSMRNTPAALSRSTLSW